MKTKLINKYERGGNDMQEKENQICQCACEKDTFLEEIFSIYKPEKDNLIQILNEIQEHYGYFGSLKHGSDDKISQGD